MKFSVVLLQEKIGGGFKDKVRLMSVTSFYGKVWALFKRCRKTQHDKNRIKEATLRRTLLPPDFRW